MREGAGAVLSVTRKACGMGGRVRRGLPHIRMSLRE